MSVHTIIESRPSFPQVRVNGHQIPQETIAREMQQHPAEDAMTAWHAAAEALVIRELLLQEAMRQLLQPDPREVDGKMESDEESLIRQLTEQEIKIEEPDEETCRMWFEKNRNRLRGPDHWDVSHILISCSRDDTQARAVARNVAAEFIKQINNDPARFEIVARKNSDCVSASQGGRMGLVARRETTSEFESAMRAMTPGETSNEPVESDYGLHILHLHAFHRGKGLDWETARPIVQDVLRDSSWRTAVSRYLNVLAGASSIEGLSLEKSQLTN